MSTVTITVPDLSGAADVDVIEVMVNVGDVIAEGDSLIAVETDKASMEVPASHSGKVIEVLMQEGSVCNEGDVILVLSAEQEVVEEQQVAAVEQAPVVQEQVEKVSAQSVGESSVEQIFVPDMSGAADVDVIEIMVKPGDVIAEGDSLIAVETDKASMEVPAPKAGTVVSVEMKEGSTCSEGDLILTLETLSSEGVVVSEAASSATESVKQNITEATATESNVQTVSEELVKVPDLSGATDVDVIEVMVKAGDKIEEGDGLITVETDKASMEVPSPFAGTVLSVSISEGESCNEGDVILRLQAVATVTEAPVAEAPVDSKNTKAAAPKVEATSVSMPAPVANAESSRELEKKNQGAMYAGPAVRALAREFGVDLTVVKGTGRRGRILKEDLQGYVKALVAKSTAVKSTQAGVVGSGIPQVPEIDFSQFGEIELEKLSKIARVTRDNMSRAWLNVPHVTQFDEADITDLEAFRKEMKDEAARSGVKLTPMPFIIKAVAKALSEHPRFNASLHADGQHLVLKKYINIGIAVDTPHGLMVPVIKDADKKSLYELANEAVELAGKAKDRKLKPNEMQGACFTISSLGGLGGTGFTPIVNTPEVAILGISKADIKPRWNGKEFEPRKMLPLCLSYDHRAINGGDGGRFLTYLNLVLSDIRRLVL